MKLVNYYAKDGCNWGEGPRRAARIACDSLVEYLVKYQQSMTNTLQAASFILEAYAHAQHSICADNAIENPIGTTTLLGGMAFRLYVSIIPNPILFFFKQFNLFGVVRETKTVMKNHYGD